MKATVHWSDERHVTIASDKMEWVFPIRYPEGNSLFALGDGTLIEVTRKGGKPRVRVLEGGASRFTYGEDGSLAIEPEADLGWVARAWDYAALE